MSQGVGLLDASVGNHHRKFQFRLLQAAKPRFVADFADGILICAGGERSHEPAGGIFALLTLRSQAVDGMLGAGHGNIEDA